MGGMVKTTVYLDEGLKADLSRASDLSGRSQADLVRDGIEQVVSQHLRGRPQMKALATGATVMDKVDELMGGFGR